MLEHWNVRSPALKLMRVRVIVRRAVAAVAFLATCVLVVQVGDATHAVPARAVLNAVLEKQAPLLVPARSDRVYTLTHLRVIPLGRSSISVPILMYHYIRPAPSIYTDYMGYRLTSLQATSQRRWTGWHRADTTRSISTICAPTSWA